MVNATAIDYAVGVRLLLSGGDGQILAIECNGNAASTLGGVDGEISLAVAALDGGSSREEGRHGLVIVGENIIIQADGLLLRS